MPGRHPAVGRDHEYARHGAVTLMAGIDLVTGHVYRAVADRHRSREFMEFLEGLDGHYTAGAKLRLILDNHSARVSKGTRGTWQRCRTASSSCSRRSTRRG